MNPTESSERLLDQLLDLERLDQIPRTGYLQRGVDPAESVAEHSWHVATLAWTMLPHVRPIDELRVLELALLHDVGELTLGDIPKPGAVLLPPGAKHTAEDRALRQLLGATDERANSIADELRERASREARFVHACDQLQMLIKTMLYARWNRGETGAFLARLLRDEGGGPPHWTVEFEALAQLRDAVRRRAKSEGLLGNKSSDSTQPAQ